MTVEEWKRKNPPIQRKPQTNADRIRAMTDEELAVWIAETSCCSDWCILRDACDKKQEHECCINVWLDWLKQEANDEEIQP